MTTTASTLRHSLITQANAMYNSIPGGVYENPNAPEWVHNQSIPVSGPDPQHLGERVTRWLTARGYTVGTQHWPNATRGETNPDAMTVNTLPGLAPADRAAVLLHEAGHVVCDHTDSLFSLLRGITGDGPCEIEAETVAFIVAGLHGLDLSCNSVAYAAGWAEGDLQTLKDYSREALPFARKLSAELDAIKL